MLIIKKEKFFCIQYYDYCFYKKQYPYWKSFKKQKDVENICDHNKEKIHQIGSKEDQEDTIKKETEHEAGVSFQKDVHVAGNDNNNDKKEIKLNYHRNDNDEDNSTWKFGDRNEIIKNNGIVYLHGHVNNTLAKEDQMLVKNVKDIGIKHSFK